jgi:threonine synthase
LPAQQRAAAPWVIVATAHPAKFAEIVEPLIGCCVAVPATLRTLLARPTSYTEIDVDLEALRQAL